jgi:hypothetical protein
MQHAEPADCGNDASILTFLSVLHNYAGAFMLSSICTMLTSLPLILHSNITVYYEPTILKQ